MSAKPEIVHASDFFIYTAQSKSASLERTTTVVFISSDSAKASDIANALASYFDRVAYPEQVWVLGTHDRLNTLVKLSTSSEILDRLPAMTRFLEPPSLIAAAIYPDGTIGVGLDPAGMESQPERTTRAIFNAGLVAIFRSHDGVLSSSGGYHYEKPSKRHSEHFLRTGNVLLYGAEIAFIAAAILGRLHSRDLRRIYTDSSSINALAYALSDTLRRLDGSRPPATVESFQGYQGIRQSHHVEPDEHSLVLISASTSGALVSEVAVTYGVPEVQQIVLFYVGDERGAVRALCDLTLRGDSGNGYLDAFESWAAAGCVLCNRGQPTVSLAGDQFLPANPTIVPRMLTARDAPPWLSEFIESVYGRTAISFHAPPQQGAIGIQHIGFSLMDIIVDSKDSAPALSKSLRRHLQRYVPVGTSWVVHLDDEDSIALANEVQSLLSGPGDPFPTERVVPASRLTDAENKIELGSGLALVTAATASSGRRLLSVSRALRAAHVSQPIAYLIFIAHPSREDDWKKLASTLSYGEGNPTEHDVRVIQRIAIPASHELDFTWEKESRQLRMIADRLLVDEDELGLEKDARESVEHRIDVLNMAPSNGGLVDDLFLAGFTDRTSGSAALQLQPNFAFWKFKFEEHDQYHEGHAPTQAEVFFTMLSVLHNMRQSHGSRAASLSNDHHWTVLSPRNFARFNDPVIQASLLRGATARELDYSSSPALSREMADMILEIVEQWSAVHGQGAAEFLLAIASDRLRLTKGDRSAVVRKCVERLHEFPPLIQALAGYLIREDSTSNMVR